MDFLVNRASVLLDQMKGRGEIAYWVFRSDGNFVFSLRPSQASAEQVIATILTQLGPVLSSVAGTIERIEPQTFPLELGLSRFGGKTGLKLASIFSRLDTRLSLDLLRLRANAEPGISRYEIGLGSIFFFNDVFQLPLSDIGRNAQRWADFFVEKNDEANRARVLEATRFQARKELSENPDVKDLLERLKRQGWKGSLSSQLQDVFLAHERKFRRLGRLVGATLEARSDRPLPLIVFHSYSHLHMFRILSAGIRELYLTTLIAESMGASTE